MLFGYPLTATEDNWLHDAVIEVVRLIHQHIGAGTPIPSWPELIPNQYRERLRTRTGIRDRLDAYREAVEQLDDVDRDRVLQCIGDQNEIPDLLCHDSECDRLADLPEALREPIARLFKFAFELLTPLGIRDDLYRAIYYHRPDHICPFCGCEYFDAPGAPREHLDHYLAKSRYPFAAANLRNLVPMGAKCNASYKKAQDVRCDEQGNPRNAFDPYDHETVRIQLLNSVLFAPDDSFAPQWNIEFLPDSEECSTWDAVFKIRERYKRDVLDSFYKNWLEQFRNYCKKSGIEQPSEEQLEETIGNFIETLEIMNIRGPHFLQVPFFHMISKYLDEGNDRLRDFMKEWVSSDAGHAELEGAQ